MTPGPLTPQQIADLYFIEHRAKLLDLAAFLDRADRAGGSWPDDVRLATFRKAITLLIDQTPERARRILELLSDPTAEPIAKAPGKGAIGVWPGPSGEGGGGGGGGA